MKYLNGTGDNISVHIYFSVAEGVSLALPWPLARGYGDLKVSATLGFGRPTLEFADLLCSGRL